MARAFVYVCVYGRDFSKGGVFFIRETVEDCGEFFGNGCSLLNYGSLQSLSGWFR